MTKQSEDEIRTLLSGYDVVLVMTVLDSHTSAMSAPIVARIAKELEVLCVVITTTPLGLADTNYQQIAQDGIITTS